MVKDRLVCISSAKPTDTENINRIQRRLLAHREVSTIEVLGHDSRQGQDFLDAIEEQKWSLETPSVAVIKVLEEGRREILRAWGNPSDEVIDAFCVEYFQSQSPDLDTNRIIPVACI